MTPGPVSPVPPEGMLGASDWDDEDLLTVIEASQRLADEIKACRARIRQAEQALAEGTSPASVDEGALDRERRRLQELMGAVERIRAAHANAPR
ncbi:hypothetical protein [Mycolicibacterium holsaticum]|uniref:hypothetical protein n=1 Tax=Mycolicibacterium holsaticum TaxID=152142 RepID=UPI001C7DA10D|nr:hypothetical protein [Mycolicibacterium holsaticum]MDA4108762.1 hypothetical protein [Mycolicibacterium holsaticum DSM 44478 = JCM 12374]QZA12531.1 hypothetical protein K3U96_26070 [Mycolicibacterium holsaticum DSM 44478 = JCM 12374]UNC09989.1 hypothetical protein H5U41_00730 [Mycolicibacterium holsaticum DSM 44478 = JCM 12374]